MGYYVLKNFILCQSLTEYSAILQYTETVALILEYFLDFISKSRLKIASLCLIMILLKKNWLFTFNMLRIQNDLAQKLWMTVTKLLLPLFAF